MTHPVIEAMARAIRQETRRFTEYAPGCSTTDLGLPSIDETEARRMAFAALRTLAACERDEARRAMLAELVKECERDG